MEKNCFYGKNDLLKKVKSQVGRVLVPIFAAFMILSSAYGQGGGQLITGVVTDEESSPLPGVNVVIKGTVQGTVTDIDGNYSINASPDATLQFSFVGFDEQSILVGNQMVVNVVMTTTASDLEEVVVVGYGVKKKSLVTGAISSVGADEISTAPATRVEQAIQGRTAGVTILPTSGSPGAGAKVRIRGTGSNLNSDPLYIVDGMKTRSIDNIEPGDIESIEVLKDASSSAIYGSEGGNGVIIISTKRGKEGVGKVS